MMKRILSILLVIIMLGMLSAVTMARQITFTDSGEWVVFSKINSSDELDTVDFNMGDRLLMTASLSGDNNIYSLGAYLAASKNWMLGYNFLNNSGNHVNENTFDLRARAQVNEDLTLATQLDWVMLNGDSTTSRKASLTAQAEYFIDDDFLLLNAGGLVVDKHNTNSDDTFDTYLVAGIEIALLANVAIFVDDQIPLNNKNEDNKITVGIACYRFKP
jgi:hypothetical protein